MKMVDEKSARKLVKKYGKGILKNFDYVLIPRHGVLMPVKDFLFLLEQEGGENEDR